MLRHWSRCAAQQLVSLSEFNVNFSTGQAARAGSGGLSIWVRHLGASAPDVFPASRTFAEEEAPSSAAAASAAVPVDEQLLVEVGVLGVPNAGKSTLTNALVGSKISAVSDKTNTTIRSRLGAFTEGLTQIVLYDTPGIVGPQNIHGDQQKRRVDSAWKTAATCDMLLFVLDAHRQLNTPDPRVIRLLEDLGKGQLGLALPEGQTLPPLALVMNKIDCVPKEDRSLLLPLADKLVDTVGFREVFWTSALSGQGVNQLREHLLTMGKPKAWAVAAGAHTDASDEDLACEIVREKIFHAFYQEVPYEIKINLVEFKSLRDGSARVEMNVVVRNDSVRAMVVGKRGAAIGFVGKAARLELEKTWNRRVHLFLNVKKG